MKKIWDFIKTWVIGAAEQPVLNQEEKFIEEFLEKSHAKNPKATTMVVSGLYMLVDTVGEDLVARTDNKYDDNQVALIKKELEEFAALKGIQLTNADND